MATVLQTATPRLGARRGAWADYLELSKPEVTSLILAAAAVGFYAGSPGALRWVALLHTLAGTLLLASGTAALNQFWERDLDARMHRTARRPLASGRMAPRRALLFGAVTILCGFAWLAAATNWLAAALGLLTSVTYLLFYTPLKRRSTLCTTVGAFPGAVPPLIGWAAAAGDLTVGAWILYAILFLWQFPHFMAIAWLYREDYGRAGIVMLPVVEPDGRSTAWQVLAASAALVPVSLALTAVGLAGPVYFAGALLLGIGFLYGGYRLARARTLLEARRLLHASVIYLPLLYGLLLIDFKN